MRQNPTQNHIPPLSQTCTFSKQTMLIPLFVFVAICSTSTGELSLPWLANSANGIPPCPDSQSTARPPGDT
ncbi:UNVERIFIED_CONTAM: hypothetical protein FKN15_022954 [Acipenser sinensis]